MRRSTAIASQFELVSGYCGKNLVPFPYVDGSQKTHNGITYTTNPNGSVNVIGTATSDSYYFLSNSIKYSERSISSGNSDGKIVVSGEKTYYNVYNNIYSININKGDVVNFVCYPMIEYGTVATSYEPYDSTRLQYINPKGGYFPYEVPQLTGKNLIPNTNNSKVDRGITFTKNADGSVTLTGTSTSDIYYLVGSPNIKLNGTYALSGCPSTGSGSTYNLYIRYAPSGGGSSIYVTDGGKGSVFVANDIIVKDCYIHITPNVTITNATFYPQLELGPVPTSYEPYAENITEEALQAWRESKWDSGIEKEYGLRVVGKTYQDNLEGTNLLDINNRELYPVSVSQNTAIDFSKKYIFYDYAASGYSNVGQTSGYSISNGIVNWIQTQNYYGIGFNLKLTPGKKHRVIAVNNGDTNYYMRKTFYDAEGKYISFTDDTAFTVPENATDVIVSFCGGSVGNFSMKDVQVVYGSTVKPYESYCGGIPTPNPDYPEEIQCVKQGTKVECCGKNLFDIDNFLSLPNNNLYYTKDEFGNLIQIKPDYRDDKSLGTAITLPKGTYYIKIDNHGDRFKMLNKSTWAIVASGSKTFSITETAEFAIKIWQPAGTNLGHLQIEIGSTATSFEPYIGNTITAPCDLYEGDIWYPMSGRVEKVRAKKTITRVNSWGADYMPNSKGTYCTFFQLMDSNRNLPILCNKLSCSNASLTQVTNTSLGIDVGASNTFSVFLNGISGITDLTTINNWLIDNPLEIIYTLTTPIIEQYDPQPLYIPPSVSVANVLQQPVNLPADLSASMLVKRLPS